MYKHVYNLYFWTDVTRFPNKHVWMQWSYVLSRVLIWFCVAPELESLLPPVICPERNLGFQEQQQQQQQHGVCSLVFARHGAFAASASPGGPQTKTMALWFKAVEI